MKNGRNICRSTNCEGFGALANFSEYEQCRWTSRDDYGATFIQAPCDAFLRSQIMPAPKTKSSTEKSSQRSRQKNLPLRVIKHNEGARSQLQNIKSPGYDKSQFSRLKV